MAEYASSSTATNVASKTRGVFTSCGGATRVPHLYSRAGDAAAELAEKVGTATAGRPGAAVAVYMYGSPAEALRSAAAMADPADRIVVFGSFYTVGGVLREGLPRLTAAHVG